MNENGFHEKLWNGVRLEEEEMEDFEIRGCRKRGKGINNMDWIDREEWRRKIKL